MPGRRTGVEQLMDTRWVHVFEEDSIEGQTYRPEDDAIPLSRRPRERFTLERDGSATLFAPGADDRFVERRGTWAEEGGSIVIRSVDGRERRVVSWSPRRLVVAPRTDAP